MIVTTDSGLARPTTLPMFGSDRITKRLSCSTRARIPRQACPTCTCYPSRTMSMQLVRMVCALVLYCKPLSDQHRVLLIALILSPQLSTLVIRLVWTLQATMKNHQHTTVPREPSRCQARSIQDKNLLCLHQRVCGWAEGELGRYRHIFLVVKVMKNSVDSHLPASQQGSWAL